MLIDVIAILRIYMSLGIYKSEVADLYMGLVSDTTTTTTTTTRGLKITFDKLEY